VEGGGIGPEEVGEGGDEGEEEDGLDKE
jgi:hypothetical protein